MKNLLLTPANLAQSLGVSTQSIRRWTDKGLIMCEIMPSGHRRYSEDALEAFKESIVKRGSKDYAE